MKPKIPALFRFFAQLLLILITLLVGDTDFCMARTETMQIKQIYRIQSHSRVLHAVVLTASCDQFQSCYNQGVGDDLAQKLIQQVRFWRTKEYRKRYPNHDSRFFRIMNAMDPISDGRSDMVVILEGENFSDYDIRATIRVAWINKYHTRLPSEDLFELLFPRVTPHLRRLPVFYELSDEERNDENSPFEALHWRVDYTDPVAAGAIGELKLFMVDSGERTKPPAEQLDLASVLIYLTEASRISNRSLPQIIHGLTNLDLLHTVRTIDELAVDYIYPSHYVLTCDQSMVDYYKRLGFKLVSGRPLKNREFPSPLVNAALNSGSNFAMSISRSDFVFNVIRQFAERFQKDAITHGTRIKAYDIDESLYYLHGENLAEYQQQFHNPLLNNCGNFLEFSITADYVTGGWIPRNPSERNRTLLPTRRLYPEARPLRLMRE